MSKCNDIFFVERRRRPAGGRWLECVPILIDLAKLHIDDKITMDEAGHGGMYFVKKRRSKKKSLNPKNKTSLPFTLEYG